MSAHLTFMQPASSEIIWPKEHIWSARHTQYRLVAQQESGHFSLEVQRWEKTKEAPVNVAKVERIAPSILATIKANDYLGWLTLEDRNEETGRVDFFNQAVKFIQSIEQPTAANMLHSLLELRAVASVVLNGSPTPAAYVEIKKPAILPPQ